MVYVNFVNLIHVAQWFYFSAFTPIDFYSLVAVADYQLGTGCTAFVSDRIMTVKWNRYGLRDFKPLRSLVYVY